MLIENNTCILFLRIVDFYVYSNIIHMYSSVAINWIGHCRNGICHENTILRWRRNTFSFSSYWNNIYGIFHVITHIIWYGMKTSLHTLLWKHLPLFYNCNIPFLQLMITYLDKFIFYRFYFTMYEWKWSKLLTYIRMKMPFLTVFLYIEKQCWRCTSLKTRHYKVRSIVHNLFKNRKAIYHPKKKRWNQRG